MRVSDAVTRLGLTVLAGETGLQRDCSGGYCSDLLSDVMAHVRAGDIWITLQTHVNVVAVATLTGAAAVVVTGGQRPDEATLQRAAAEGVTILVTDDHSFAIAGRLYGLLQTGEQG